MTDHPPLRREGLDVPRQVLHLHDHAVCAYDTPEQMLATLAVFVEEGRKKNELIVFVHSFESEDAAWRFIQRAAPDVLREHPEQIVIVSLYETAFEGGARRIDYEHVARVVEGIGAQAKNGGRDGARIFVDASRQYLSRERAKEWFAFESWLGRRLQARVGLVCAYRRSDIMREEILPEVLRTHAYRFDAPS